VLGILKHNRDVSLVGDAIENVLDPGPQIEILREATLQRDVLVARQAWKFFGRQWDGCSGPIVDDVDGKIEPENLTEGSRCNLVDLDSEIRDQIGIGNWRHPEPPFLRRSPRGKYN
jgi:hypothetical protein